MLEISLVLAALLIGATGTFSPCGLSVIETIGPTGHTGGRRTTIAACAAFLPGAVIGGLLTFGALALAGEALHGAGGRIAYVVAAAIAAFAAALELRGTRIVPQIRRQLPEHWRRVMPMPVAAALYGVLLGIGFTTFVLSFGVWALAGISLALGDPALGLLVGAGFGLGRAIPVVALAPHAGRPLGFRATELMCERPGVYLGLRRGDAAALLAAGLALAFAPGSAIAASTITQPSAADPSTSQGALAFESLPSTGVLRSSGIDFTLPGSDPAIGGSYIAVIRSAASIQLLARGSLAPVAEYPAPGADALAVSDRWLVWRAPLASGGDALFARGIANPASATVDFTVATAPSPTQISHPALDGDTLLYGTAGTGRSRIARLTLPAVELQSNLVSAGSTQIFSPAVFGDTFAYVRTDARHSRLMIRPLEARGPGKVLLSVKRARSQLWSTALTDTDAFVTILAAGAGGSSILSVPRADARKARGLNHAPRGGGNHKH